MRHILCTDYEKMFENIVEFTWEYLNDSKLKALVLGMSGGIDSTLTAALAREVCAQSSKDIELVGRVLPIESNNIETNRGIFASRVFCHNYQVNDMIDIYNSTANYFMPKPFVPWHTYAPNRPVSASTDIDAKTRIRQGNIKARLRMINLYDTAQRLDGMVLSTDNYTEYLLGFWTLHGDVGDYGMLQNLWKTEVYGLAIYMATKYNIEKKYSERNAMLEAIEAMPTDGLGISESDFDQIHPNYNKNHTPVEVYGEVDAILLDYLNGGGHYDNHKVIQRYKATAFKRLNPFSIPRGYIVG